MELWLVATLVFCVLIIGLCLYLWHRGAIKVDKAKAGAMGDSVIQDVKNWRDHLGRK